MFFPRARERTYVLEIYPTSVTSLIPILPKELNSETRYPFWKYGINKPNLRHCQYGLFHFRELVPVSSLKLWPVWEPAPGGHNRREIVWFE